MFTGFFYMYSIYFLALFYKKRLKFPKGLYMEFLDISNVYICMDTNIEKFAINKVKTSNIASYVDPVYTACLLVRYLSGTISPKTLHVILLFQTMVFKLLILLGGFKGGFSFRMSVNEWLPMHACFMTTEFPPLYLLRGKPKLTTDS